MCGRILKAHRYDIFPFASIEVFRLQSLAVALEGEALIGDFLMSESVARSCSGLQTFSLSSGLLGGLT